MDCDINRYGIPWRDAQGINVMALGAPYMVRGAVFLVQACGHGLAGCALVVIRPVLSIMPLREKGIE